MAVGDDQLRHALFHQPQSLLPGAPLLQGLGADLHGQAHGIQLIQVFLLLFGVFPHHAERKNYILLRGFDDVFMVPHSRHTTVMKRDVQKIPALKILSESDEAGIYVISTNEGRQIFVLGHSEYDPETLALEYWRDRKAGLPIQIPCNYFPNDDDSKQPVCSWRSSANLLYSNWLNYFVYQQTPYDARNIKELNFPVL